MTPGSKTVWAGRGRPIVTAGMLGLSLLSIQCARRTPLTPLTQVERESFQKCSAIDSPNEQIKYLATASPTGAYVLLGDAIAKIANDNPETQLVVCTSDGSGENLAVSTPPPTTRARVFAACPKTERLYSLRCR